MKKTVALILLSATTLIASCGNAPSSSSSLISSEASSSPSYQYTSKDVNVYVEANKVARTIPLRFYEKTPHVPYIGVKQFYKEFFKSAAVLSKRDDVYTFLNQAGGYWKFNVSSNVVTLHLVDSFSYHPDLVSQNTKSFLYCVSEDHTRFNEKSIPLSNYGITVYPDESDAYVPVTLLSNFSGGSYLYQIAYNGKDLYVSDCSGELGGPSSTVKYFAETYFDVLKDVNAPRPDDLIQYTYKQLCLMFDNDRGYTTQLTFGDNNLLSLGLDGLLSAHHPRLKAKLLSADKKEYMEGYILLFCGLNDGGHTGILFSDDIEHPFEDPSGTPVYLTNLLNKWYEDPDFHELVKSFMTTHFKSAYAAEYARNRNEKFGLTGAEAEFDPGFYYHFDETHKTSYIGFNGFIVDNKGWDDFYKGKGEAPTSKDSFGHIRSKLYQAKEDGAENVVLDLAANGGGSSDALCGIVGLFNKAKCDFSMNNILHKYRVTEHCKVDVNLDGKFDDLDAEEAAKFDFNVGILTSGYSFSCGNLLPSLLKELGYKIIGEQSGGGSCAINYQFTADGLPFIRSSRLCLSNAAGENIDSGVPVDFDIKAASGKQTSLETAPYFYDVALVSEYLKNAYAA